MKISKTRVAEKAGDLGEDYKDEARALSSVLQDLGCDCPCGFSTPRVFLRWWHEQPEEIEFEEWPWENQEEEEGEKA